jgi:hypothetical protein
MTELLFGSLPQLWPTIPIQPFGFFQTPMAGIGRPFNGAPPANTTGPAVPLPGGATMFAGAEIPTGITAQALLAAVAAQRGQPMGPTSDSEVEDFISDALDVTPGASDVEVRCENGRVILTGSVSHKRLKRDAGEIAWAIPSVNDVQNNVTIVMTRRRTRSREPEPSPPAAGRKQSS